MGRKHYACGWNVTANNSLVLANSLRFWRAQEAYLLSGVVHDWMTTERLRNLSPWLIMSKPRGRDLKLFSSLMVILIITFVWKVFIADFVTSQYS
jgi:hypothetical protein